MNLTRSFTLITAQVGFVLGVLCGVGAMKWAEGTRVANAKAELAGLQAQHSDAVAQVKQEALNRVLAANIRADVLQTSLDQTERNLAIAQMEKQRAIKQFTTGRACLNSSTVRLLNDEATHGTPSRNAATTLSDTTRWTLARDAATATDTDVATWANHAIGHYNQCRARLAALIDWHAPLTENRAEDKSHE